MDLVETWAKITVIVLFFFAIGGVLLHAWYSSRLTLFSFNTSNPSDKKSLKRICVPWLIVVLISAALPFWVVYSHSDLHGLFEPRDPDLDFVTFPWKFIMPVFGMEVSIFTCIFIGSIFYLLFGYISLQAWKTSYRKKFGN